MVESVDKHDPIAPVIFDIVTTTSAVVMQWGLKGLGVVSEVSDNIDQFGYTSSDFLTEGLSVSAILHPSDYQRVFQELRRSIDNDHLYVVQTFRMIDSKGSVRWINCWTIIDRSKEVQSGNLKSIFADFTAHKLAEQRFNIQEADYQRIISNSGANYFFYIHNSEGVFTYLSPTVKDMLGYTEDEFLTHYARYLTDHPVNDLVEFYTTQALQGHKQPPYQIDIRHKNSTHHRLEVTEVPVYDSQGKVFSVVGFAHDITKLVQQQTLLEENQRYLNSILNGLADAVVTLDAEHNVLSFNKAAEKMFGYSSEEAIGLAVARFVQLESDDEGNPHFATPNSLSGKELDTQNNPPLEATAYHKDQTVTPVRIHITTVPGQENQYILSCTDISFEKSQERRLRRAQKMDALGKMTGGICHDFNNLLGIITGYVSLLESKENLDPQSLEYLSKISAATERGTHLSHKLLSFSASKSAEKKVLSINEALQHEQPMLARALTPVVHIEMNLAPHLWPILINKEDFSDSILNIFINAGHAMPNGGTLSVSTENLTIDEFEAQPLNVGPGEYVCLRIKDSGLGMDSKTVRDIFDPFFTTKEKGTGLGLSQVYNFMKRSKGGISVVSEPNIGSEFLLYFPRYLGDISDNRDQRVEPFSNSFHSRSSHSQPSKTTTGHHILVVDDEPDLREITAEFLSLEGHYVYKAGDGQQALTLLSEHPIELIISDIMMPEMDGWTLAREARKKSPNIKIQLVSGYEGGAQSDLIEQDNELLATLLYKPLSRQTLLEQIDKLFKDY